MGRLDQLSKRISIYQEKGKPIKSNRDSKNPEDLAKLLLKLPEEEFQELESLLGKSLTPVINVIIASKHSDNIGEREDRVKKHLVKEGVLKT